MQKYNNIMGLMSGTGKYTYRLGLAHSSYKLGIKPAARLFKCTVKTVRKWRRRYEQQGASGLQELSRRPHKMPNRCPADFEEKVLALRRTTRNRYGAEKLIERFAIKEYGKSCLKRIIREHGLKRERKTRVKKRKHLWSVKRLYKAFEKIQVDVKVLTDIGNYWPQYLRHRESYPRYEVTARDVKTGAAFVGLMKRNNQTNTATFIYLLGEHLKAQGFELSKITIQTDNGMEFNAGGQRHSGKTGFARMVTDHWGMQLKHIPPAAPTFNSDVETFHRLVEDEFYSIEQHEDLEDMRRKEYTYMLDFNYLRKNRNKDNQTPWEILRQDCPGA
ncbi:putative integrase, partial [Candidatus Termititenax aidoneus]